jgi:hypothetical protein
VVVVAVESPESLAERDTGLWPEQRKADVRVVVVGEPYECFDRLPVGYFDFDNVCYADFKEVALRNINGAPGNPLAALRTLALSE